MESLRERIKEIEREEIIRALMTSNWVMSRAARKLGITERMIGYKVRKYNITKRGGSRHSGRQEAQKSGR